LVPKRVVATRATARVRGDESKARQVEADVAKPAHAAIDLSRTEFRRAFRVDEEIDVFGKSIQHVPSFGQARSAFEDRALWLAVGDHAKHRRDPVVLLDERVRK
jgi:hypothetical protein